MKDNRMTRVREKRGCVRGTVLHHLTKFISEAIGYSVSVRIALDLSTGKVVNINLDGLSFSVWRRSRAPISTAV